MQNNLITERKIEEGGYDSKHIKSMDSFEVNFQKLNKDFFSKKRDSKEETLRKNILEAFNYAEFYYEIYDKPFEAMLPEIKGEKTVKELVDLTKKLGYELADHVYFFILLAARLQNGETWEDIYKEVYGKVIYRDEYGNISIYGLPKLFKFDVKSKDFAPLMIRN